MLGLSANSAVAYRSVIAFGTIRIVADLTVIQRFFEALMDTGRPIELGQKAFSLESVR
jgi:nitroimidazol reductase NimA-like FMN-containing flavoprotein (pyridoxamine 5'-phosphate oxidase superfamily)